MKIFFILSFFLCFMGCGISETTSPVSLPPYSFTDGGNFIIAKGSWLSDTKLSDKASTVQVHCQADWGYCVETIAAIGHAGGNMLTIYTEYWKIKEWGEDKILFYENSSATCVNYNYSVDKKIRLLQAQEQLNCRKESIAKIFQKIRFFYILEIQILKTR